MIVRALAALAVIGSSAGIVVASMVASAPPAAAQSCDTWNNTSGGAWDTGSNWSDNAPPSGSTDACITAPGSYTVTIGNETITAGALTVGGSGSTPTLSIGNSGSGEPDITFASVSNSGTIESGFGGSFTVSGNFTNTGAATLEVPNTGFGGTALNVASLDNQGSFEVNATTTYTLPTSSSTLLNDSTGTISVASGNSLTITSPSGQTGTVTQDGVLDNSGQFIAAAAVTVQGGSICNNPLQVGMDGQAATTDGLAFASSVGSGPSCGTGIPTDNIFIANIAGSLSGNIPSAYTVSVGDGGSASARITIPSAMTVEGTLNLGNEGSLSSTAAITNMGTIDAVASSFAGEAFNLSSLTNKGALDVNTPSTYELPKSSSTLVNSSSGTISVASGNSLTITSPSGQTGTVTQDGVLDNSGQFIAAAAVTVQGGSICNNPLQVGMDGQAATTDGLAFASSVGSGPSCGTGIPTDNIFIANIAGSLSGNIPSAYTVSVGDGGSASARITIPSAMTVEGTLNLGNEGSLSSTAAITNMGTIDAVSSSFAGEAFNLSSLTNKGALDVNTPSTYELPKSSSTLVNSSSGTISVASGNSLTITSPSGQTGTVTQDGVIDNSGAMSMQNPLTIDGGTVCGNEVQVGVDGETGGSLAFATTVGTGPACGTGIPTDQLFMANITSTLTGTVPKAYTVAIGDGGASFANITASGSKNLGTIEPGFGATLTFSGNLKNKGTLEVPVSSFTTIIDLGGTLTNKKAVVFDGATQISAANFNNEKPTSTVSVGGLAVSLTGPLSNAGVLSIAAGGSLAISSSYEQGSTAMFDPQLASTSSYGVLNVTDGASVAGTVAASDAAGFTPPSGSTYVVLTSGGLGGTSFEHVTGAFTAQYITNDTDAQLTAN